MKLLWHPTSQTGARVQGERLTHCPTINTRLKAPLIGGVVSVSLFLEAPLAYSEDQVQTGPEAKGVAVETLAEEQEIIEAIRETFPEAPDEAVAIAECESELDVKAVSPTEDVGLMQINLPSHGEELEERGLDGFDLEDNLAYSRVLYEESGWEPWVCAEKLGITDEDSPTS